MLSDQDLSNLLFAAIGVNRPADGKLTSPTARNFQEIRVFVFTSKGVSEYLNKENALKRPSSAAATPTHDDGRSRHQEASQAFGLAGALAEQSRRLREVIRIAL